MKTDRELLELAAKAAGISIQRCRLEDPICMDMLLLNRTESGNGIGWNPLTDDGDALRLAVILKFQVTIGTYRDHEVTVFNKIMVEVTEYVGHQKNMMMATRRAIVRTAAAIGEAMP